MSQQPFHGVRVVEFGQFVAVPYCGQLLADGGADVIKVEALIGDSSRHILALAPGETRIFLARNRGKRSLPLSLKHEAAREVMDALLAWADVALMNFRPGLAETIGLDGANIQGLVESLRFTVDGPFLILEDGTEVPMSNVLSVAADAEDLAVTPEPPTPDPEDPPPPTPDPER